MLGPKTARRPVAEFASTDGAPFTNLCSLAPAEYLLVRQRRAGRHCQRVQFLHLEIPGKSLQSLRIFLARTSCFSFSKRDLPAGLPVALKTKKSFFRSMGNLHTELAGSVRTRQTYPNLFQLAIPPLYCLLSLLLLSSLVPLQSVFLRMHPGLPFSLAAFQTLSSSNCHPILTYLFCRGSWSSRTWGAACLLHFLSAYWFPSFS
jgi:hypothetical protein